jgi:hypothetical protein
MKTIYTLLFITIFFIPALYSQTLHVPPRSSNSLNGTQVISMLTPLSLTAREDSIFNNVIRGNVPDFLRNLIAVSDTINISSTPIIVTYYVIPDYMALGCDSDYFLCPMTPLLAQRVADYIGCSLPTRKMVNDIWQNATVKMAPQPISPSAQMTTVPVFADHDSMVWNQRSTFINAHPLGELVAGDKKDVILSNHIYGNPSPGRVVIYGWHYQNGSPIQPLYYGHEETYADYSHGIRMVQNEILVDGCMTTIQNILQSSTLNTLLSDESTIAIPRYPVTAITVSKPTSFCVLNQASGTIRIKAKNSTSIAGYNVSLSHDGKCFELPTYYNYSQFDISGLISDSIYFVKVAAVGSSGGVSDYSEVLGATTNDPNPYTHYLVINAFDRATTGNTYDFIRQHGTSIKHNNLIFSSATNEAITDTLIVLDDFNALDYILGEESSVNETFSDQEQLMLKNSHVPYFVSGSEIGWDLDHLGTTSDKDFYHNYLFATYVEDAPNNQASTYYNATISAPYNNVISFTYDNGSRGTYDVRYPDVITPNTIGTWQGAPLASFDAFPLKNAGCFYWNKMVYLTIPFETIYPESKRDSIMGIVNMIFFLMSSAQENNSEISKILIYPNPANNSFTLMLNSLSDETVQVQIQSVQGKTIESKQIDIFSGTNQTNFDVSKLHEGLYLISVKGEKNNATEKLIISH